MPPRARTLVNVVLAALALAYTTSAAPPDWWQTRGVMDASQTHNDFAAANTGQLKHITKQAMLEMDAHLIGGAGTAIHAMVDAWSTPGVGTNDFAAVNVGQVKAVAKLFYDRLNQLGLALPLPWTPTEPEKNDFAAVNIGQLKNIFAFKVPTVTTLDLDSDGIHDWWVNHFFPQNSSLLSQSSPSDDPDHDLLTNAEEFKNGTNPNSGADGLVIQLEVFQRSGFARSGGFMHLATDNTPFRSRKYTSTFEATHEGGIPYSESFSWSIDETYTHPIVTGTLVALLNQPAYELMAMVTETTSGDITRVPSFDFYYLFDLVDEDHVEEAIFNRHSYYYEPQSPTSQGSAELANVTEYASPITAAEMFAALESDLYPISPAPEIIHSNTYASVATRNQGPNFYAVDASICEYRYVLRSKNGANLLLDAPKNVMWIESVEVALNGLEYGGPHNAQIRNAALNLGNATPLHALDARPYIASGPPGNITAYHRVNLLPIDLAIDADRNGTIASGETASQAKPLRFWINNDSDTGETDKEEEGNTPDHQDGYFTNIRDLEDFQLLKVSIPEDIYTKVLNSEAQIGLKWKSTSDGSPSVKVYRASNEVDESKDYIWNKSKATSQSSGQLNSHSIATVSSGSTVWLPANALQNVNGGQNPYLLFEGAAKGSGQLCLVIKMGSGSSEVEGPGVWLKLMDVEEMFASAQGTPGMPYPNPPDHVGSEPPRPATGFQNIYWPGRGQFEQDPDETNEAIIMVHGWNMTNPDRRTFSESFFKRLWWKGYKGRFATFAWPTYNVDDDALGFIPDHYNKSEYVAWKYGPALMAYVNSISKGSKHVAAHSMGNVVVASALKSGLSVGSYVAMEAALPAGCYDASSGANSYADFLDAEQVRVTPDLASALGYRGVMAGISGNFFNFHSANDYALKTGVKFGLNVSWEGNQIDYKPNYQLHYQHNPGAAGAAKNRIEDSVTLEGNTTYFGRDITDHHEVMSFIARPRSPALGTLDTTGFTNFDLRDNALKYPFGTDRTEHSGQYQRPIQKTHFFFNKLLDSMDVEFNFLEESEL